MIGNTTTCRGNKGRNSVSITESPWKFSGKCSIRCWAMSFLGVCIVCGLMTANNGGRAERNRIPGPRIWHLKLFVVVLVINRNFLVAIAGTDAATAAWFAISSERPECRCMQQRKWIRRTQWIHRTTSLCGTWKIPRYWHSRGPLELWWQRKRRTCIKNNDSLLCRK